MTAALEWTRALRWARWSLASFLGALVLTLGMFFGGGYSGADPAAEAIRDALGVGVMSLRTVLLLAGAATGVVAVSAALTRGRAMPDAGPPGAPTSGMRAGPRLALAAVFAAGNLGVILAGVMHILVWNPLARVPGLSLDEVYGRMAAVGEGTLAGGFVGGWAVFWGLATLAYVAACGVPALAPFFSARRVAVLGLFLIGATCAFAWMAGFNMGMSLADTFATSGGVAAVSGPLLSVFGQLSIVAALFLVVAPRSPRAAAAPVTA